MVAQLWRIVRHRHWFLSQSRGPMPRHPATSRSRFAASRRYFKLPGRFPKPWPVPSGCVNSFDDPADACLACSRTGGYASWHRRPVVKNTAGPGPFSLRRYGLCVSESSVQPDQASRLGWHRRLALSPAFASRPFHLANCRYRNFYPHSDPMEMAHYGRRLATSGCRTAGTLARVKQQNEITA